MVVEFSDIISPEVNRYVQQLTRSLHDDAQIGILEVVPTYRSVMVCFDPLTITRQELIGRIRKLLDGIELQQRENVPARLIQVPVCYGGVLGPDLEHVSRYTGLPAEKVIQLHTSKPYLVYMLGFTPGFPYLGSLSDKLIIPRKEKPLLRVPAGSVGITGNQTGFYPSESSGEWWLIGRTPIKTMDLKSRQSFLIAPGDYVQFFAVGLDEYFEIRKQVVEGQYFPSISHM